jgi:uncharacterized protein (TIGR02217 family)
MAKFPETNPTPNYPLTIIPKWRTIKTPMESGKEQRRSAWVYPQFDVKVNYTAMVSSNAQNLYEFYMARQGSYEAFHIYDMALHRSISRTHTGLFVGNGDSTTVTFDLPGRSVSAETIYIDGSSQSTSNYTLVTGGGVSSSDRVTFSTSILPSTGEVITADFTGYLRIRARFADDNMPFELFEANLQRTGSISLIGLAST